MEVQFRSKSEDFEIDFITECLKDGNKYIFNDESLSETTLIVEPINDKEIILERIGQTSMKINFILGKRTQGTYNNKNGLIFNFEVHCKEIYVEKNSIYFDYDYYMEDELKSSHKIWIIIK